MWNGGHPKTVVDREEAGVLWPTVRGRAVANLRGLYAIGDGIPTVEDWGTWVKDENTFASKLQELETKAAVAGGVAHDELDVFWAAEGGLTEEDDEVFSDLDYDGGA